MVNNLKNRNPSAHETESIDESSFDGRELRKSVTEEFNLSEMSGMSRKRFLALMSASAAFAAAGCSNYKDQGEIVPYTKKPEEVTPGVPNYYASTCTGCSQSCGILIKTREGRPIKIDGNPDHPVNRGKICAKGQASILNLYDPYRLRTPKHARSSGQFEEWSWNRADELIVSQLEETVRTGKEIALLTRAVHSPTTKKMLDDFKIRYPGAAVYSYSLFHDENRRNAWKKCYGSGELPVIEWEKAKIILALESDFLGTDGMAVEQIRKFTDGRNVMNSSAFNRLYCVEGALSLTGANADYRLRLRTDAQLEFVTTLAKELGGSGPAAGLSLKEFAQKHELSEDILQNLANDLKSCRGEAIIYAGSILSEEVHIAVNYLNDLLGNTAVFSQDHQEVSLLPLSTQGEIETLVEKMKTGRIGVVIHFDSNPLYHLSRQFDYAVALKSVLLSISLSESENETSRNCTMVLPINHAFESWGDYQVRTGILSLQQPVIAPLHDTRQKEAVLLAWMGKNASSVETVYHTYLMNRWEKEVFPLFRPRVDFKTFWYSSLHDGAVEFQEQRNAGRRFKSDVSVLNNTIPVAGVAVALTESCFLGDGSFANNGWLQELPDPITNIVWDNYASLSPGTAKVFQLNNTDLMEVRLPQGAITVPVLLQPGQADNFISLSLGYGRTIAGPVGSDVGVNAHVLLSKQSLSGTRVFTGAEITKAPGSYQLVSTQEHPSLNDEFTKDLHLKRKIIREGTLSGYEANPAFLHKDKSESMNITKEVEYPGVKWAMAIDLNKCIACGACVAGCNVENNIPVVGKEQAAKGRVMQWIRIDRYYSGTDADPLLSHQPMLCQHCDNAPCENVCPVAATNHSPDGLNQMVYNRCVGTKYCSNNCPYKVRRFNFFNWRDDFQNGYYEQQPVSLVHNPEVTVRSRGVMEKCTFCIQRIMEARQHAIEQGRELKGSDVTTACQAACPAEAIVFGDMNDSSSNIARYRKHPLGYSVLEELNVRPNVTYIAKLRNKSNATTKK
ncbi:MAG: 4Fe-4S dicluster domain-containing protein [Ignavibacteriae bacterium]|nr:MAG: 4Fe-4S dicluster domain-containing protein [Ignavibacteriota bacterium]